MKNKAVFLFDQSGVMALPWLEAGFECWLVDIAHPVNYRANGITTDGLLNKVHFDLAQFWLPPFEKSEIAFVAAFVPCDHLAVSGASWFKGKGLRKLSQSINLFATAAEFCEWANAPYCIENPVSTISTYWREPNHRFHPHWFTRFAPENNYTKHTCLWTGHGFVMPERAELEQGKPDNKKIVNCPPGANRKYVRSETPIGFSRAVFQVNQQNKKGDSFGQV